MGKHGQNALRQNSSKAGATKASKAAAKRGRQKRERRKAGGQRLRHTYRSWLDAVGTGIAVQQKLMRHADIRTTMNVYWDGVTNEMKDAHEKVAGLAFGKPN